MLCPIVLALTLSGHPGQAPPDASGAAAGAPRVAHFVLEEHGDEGPLPVAVVAFRRVPGEAGLLLEQEIVFRRSGLRVLIDEHHDLPGAARSPRLVWRELRSSPSTGRTWLAEWDATAGEVVTANYGTRAPVHGRLAGPRPLFPLALVEALRAGVPLVRVETLDALSRDRVLLDVSEQFEGVRRAVELRREDGSLAARYVFLDRSLVELQLQAGRRVARPCDGAEFERLSERWKAHYDPLEDLRTLTRTPRPLGR